MWRHFTLSICPTKVTLGWANLHISGFKELEQLCALLTKMYALALSVMANYPVWPEVKVTISSTYKSQDSRRGNNTCNAHFKPNGIRITYPFKKAIICYKSCVRVGLHAYPIGVKIYLQRLLKQWPVVQRFQPENVYRLLSYYSDLCISVVQQQHVHPQNRKFPEFGFVILPKIHKQICPLFTVIDFLRTTCLSATSVGQLDFAPIHEHTTKQLVITCAIALDISD